MSLFTKLRLARDCLGVEPGADRAAWRRAYRQQLSLHPPDRDGDGFRRVREAYELLCSPIEPMRQRLRDPLPLVPPPVPAPHSLPPIDRDALATAMLRALA